MAHDVVENNTKKEVTYALIGTLLFLGIVLLIGISALLRPAGDHVDVKALNAAASAAAATSAPATTGAASTTGSSSATATTSATANTAATSNNASSTANTGATLANADTDTHPDTTVASPDKAKLAATDKPKDTPDAVVASPEAVADRKAKTEDAKQDIKKINGKAPAIDVPITENDSKTGEAKVTSKVPAAQEKAGSTEPGQATQ